MARRRRDREASHPSSTPVATNEMTPSPASPGPSASAESVSAGVTFGQMLTRAREAKGLTLDDLAHRTKIRRAIIEAIETNAKRDLPEKVFILGYIRSYAIAVGLNVDETFIKFNAAWGNDSQVAAVEETRAASRSLSWMMPVGAFLILVCALWYVIRMP